MHFLDLASDELSKPVEDVVLPRLQSLLELSVRSSIASSDEFKVLAGDASWNAGRGSLPRCCVCGGGCCCAETGRPRCCAPAGGAASKAGDCEPEERRHSSRGEARVCGVTQRALQPHPMNCVRAASTE